jgi:hypothetical protein
MLIRTEQTTILGRSAGDAFETRLLAHIQKFFPIHWREVGQQHLRGVVHLGVTNAADHGLETQREIYLFVSLMLYLGSYFDTDNQLPWVTACLNDMSETDAYLRIEKTYDAALEYLDRVDGPNGQYLTAAMERFTKVAQDLSRQSPEALLGALGWIYPEKHCELNEAQLRHLVEQGYECVRTYGLDAPQGVFLCAGLSFLLGHGFAKDPQFRWAADVLNDPGISDPAQRVTAMKEASVLHLSRWLPATGRTE